MNNLKTKILTILLAHLPILGGDDFVHDALSTIDIHERLLLDADIDYLEMSRALDSLVKDGHVMKGYVWGVPKYKAPVAANR